MAERLIKHIEKKAEIYPDKHDVSYELVRETVKALSAQKTLKRQGLYGKRS
ncbi:hypothetical protein [Candidatus Contubernalis alkaliaceticus]|uniref:hypothetical protein n=1 Tax=Candidatus Contubernalis alkaliaceticus TaxID=338645 RepID=UPI001F4C23B2|nr:hypothetical protein [Candidatus Contubernalis alkalaceticus]UNC91240.1 hypothetical protein HUE98_03535 [Candidatus Contubernalis alkalaceticus]